MSADYVIVGGGPTGLTIAWGLAQYGHTSIIIDRNSSLGGCHRVTRVKGEWTEHGPRIYVNNYFCIQQILKEMGSSWDQIFVPYKFEYYSIGSELLKMMNTREYFAFFKAYCSMFFAGAPSIATSMDQFMQNNNFKQETRDYIDRICRLTDGAGADRYTLQEFLQLINENIFYGIYQPRQPNDIGLFRIWENALIQTKRVQIVQDQPVRAVQLDPAGQRVLSVQLQSGQYVIARKGYIMAVAPRHLLELLQRSNIAATPYGDITQWVKASDYLNYIPISYHWNRTLKLQNVWGYPRGRLGIASIPISQYTQFNSVNSRTVITSAVTYPKRIQSNDMQQLQQNVYEELNRTYGNLPKPTIMITSPQVKESAPDPTTLRPQWINGDTAFMLTPAGFAPFPMRSPRIPNLYSVGTHNGHSKYSFTSMEAAMQNAYILLHDLVPESQNRYKRRGPLQLMTVLRIAVAVLVAIVIYWRYL